MTLEASVDGWEPAVASVASDVLISRKVHPPSSTLEICVEKLVEE